MDQCLGVVMLPISIKEVKMLSYSSEIAPQWQLLCKWCRLLDVQVTATIQANLSLNICWYSGKSFHSRALSMQVVRALDEQKERGGSEGSLFLDDRVSLGDQEAELRAVGTLSAHLGPISPASWDQHCFLECGM